jgi:hypothetical protein
MTTATNGRRITTHEATITTASIEIKTLTVRSKQVTLAVFRQLHNKALIDERSGHLLGVPWGTVHYFWGECKEDAHLHVVWQEGLELRRCCLSAHPTSRYWFQAIQGCGSIYLHVRLAEGWRPNDTEMDRYHYLPEATRHAVIVKLTVDDYPLHVPLGSFGRATRYGTVEFDQAKIHANVPPDDGADAYAAIQGAVAQWRAFEARWREHYHAILGLDQLFIAV